jgi:hypothetical protein
MTRKTLLAAFAASLLATATFAADRQPVETLTQELEVGDATNLSVEFPVGNLALIGTGGDKIQAQVSILCEQPTSSACRRVVEKAKIKLARTGKGLVLKVEGWPKSKGAEIELDGRIEIPRGMNVLAEVEVGDFSAQGFEGNLDVDVEVGEASVEAKASDIGKVLLDAGVGDVALKVDGTEVEGDGLVGQDLKWTGKGKAMISIDVNVGDILVTLD